MNHVKSLGLILVIACSCNSESLNSQNNTPSRPDIFSLSNESWNRQEFTQLIDEKLKELNVKSISIAVINQGEIVYDSTWGIANNYTRQPVNRKSVYEAASLSKPVFAFYTMMLAERGILNLDDSINDYLIFEELKDDLRTPKITIRDILGHTTGLPNWRWQMPDQKLSFIEEPGTVFTYSGEAYVHLSKIISQELGLDLYTLADAIQQELADPLGLNPFTYKADSITWTHLVDGHDGDKIVFDYGMDRFTLNSPGGLYTNASEYAKFLKAILEGKMLSNKAYSELFKKHSEVSQAYTDLTGITTWGLGFARIPSEKHGLTITHGGNNFGYTSNFSLNLKNELGYVFMTNSNQISDLSQWMDDLLLPGIKADSLKQ
jgi:CubicO group peptidase (beta-lactamase class C family)